MRQDMSPDPLVIAELRELFKSGATPSRLMRHIIAHHGQQIIPWTNKLIRAYFREAFGIPMFRASADLLAMGPEGLRIAPESAVVIHEMVKKRTEWDRSRITKAEETWMDSLAVTEALKQTDSTQTESFAGNSNWWNQLDDETKQYVKEMIVYTHSLSLKVAILSTLAEQLQQQILVLEDHFTPSSPLQSSPHPSCGE